MQVCARPRSHPMPAAAETMALYHARTWPHRSKSKQRHQPAPIRYYRWRLKAKPRITSWVAALLFSAKLLHMLQHGIGNHGGV